MFSSSHHAKDKEEFHKKLQEAVVSYVPPQIQTSITAPLPCLGTHVKIGVCYSEQSIYCLRLQRIRASRTVSQQARHF
jgi:hypothetical protein